MKPVLALCIVAENSSTFILLKMTTPSGAKEMTVCSEKRSDSEVPQVKTGRGPDETRVITTDDSEGKILLRFDICKAGM